MNDIFYSPASPVQPAQVRDLEAVSHVFIVGLATDIGGTTNGTQSKDKNPGQGVISPW